MSAHGSAFGGGRRLGGRVRNAVGDAPESGLHTIRDARRQFVGPLVHRLIRDADCLGGGGHRTPEQFNGFGLQHGSLNHSSGRCATIVQHSSGNISTMVEYKDRLVWAMATANVTTTALAEHLGISYQAVKKAMDGSTSALAAPNHAKAAKLLRVSSDWLALGEGEPRPSKLSIADLSGPEAQMLGHFRQLSPDEQHFIEVEINNAYVRVHPGPGPANPFANAPLPTMSQKTPRPTLEVVPAPAPRGPARHPPGTLIITSPIKHDDRRSPKTRPVPKPAKGTKGGES